LLKYVKNNFAKTSGLHFAHRREQFVLPAPSCIGRANGCVDLISDALPFGRLWYGEPNAVSNAIGYAMHRSRSHYAVIRVYDDAGNVIETQEHKCDFKEP
jgi:hypothetical protein